MQVRGNLNQTQGLREVSTVDVLPEADWPIQRVSTRQHRLRSRATRSPSATGELVGDDWCGALAGSLFRVFELQRAPVTGWRYSRTRSATRARLRPSRFRQRASPLPDRADPCH